MGRNRRYFKPNLSVEEVRESIKRLRKQEIIIPISESKGETRFDFHDQYERLRHFIYECVAIIDRIAHRLESDWIFMKKKPTSEEINWYSSIVGREEMKKFFMNIENERTRLEEMRKEACKDWHGDSWTPNLDRRHAKRMKKDQRELIKEVDLWNKRWIQKLEEDYSDVKASNKTFYDLGKEIISPPFLH